MSISGKKFQPDYNGDPLKGTVESSFIRYMIGQELSTNEKLIYVKSIWKRSSAMNHHHATMLKLGIHDIL